MRDALATVREDTRERLAGVLTPAQLERFDELREALHPGGPRFGRAPLAPD